MNCDAHQDRLIDLLHHELDDAQRAETQAHLAECGDCARACCSLQAELSDITFALSQRPEAGVRESLFERVESEFAPPWWKRSVQLLARPVPVYGALALAALPLLFVFIPQLQRPGSASSSPMPSEARVEHYDAAGALGLGTVLF